MDVDIKEEPPIEIDDYTLMNETVGQDYGFPEDDQESPGKKRKRTKKSENIRPYDASDEMQQLLREWGLEVLCERFSKNLIDLSVVDYIVDVDIVDLCRDLPIRYRLILRHKLEEKRGKRSSDNSDSTDQKGHEKLLKYMSALERSSINRKKALQPENQEEQFPKRDLCPIDMVLNRPFLTRSEEEKRLLVSMEIPRPSMPDLKSTCKIKAGTTTMNRNFYKSRYASDWWLCGSQKRNKLFCWPCLLFSHPDDLSNAAWSKKGFNDLNHLSCSLKSHRTSQKHLDHANSYMDYGKSATTMDNATPPPPSGSEIVTTGTVSKPKRSSKGSAKAASNGIGKQANGKKANNKSSAANAPMTMGDDHNHTVKTENLVINHQSSKLHLESLDPALISHLQGNVNPEQTFLIEPANSASILNDIKQEVAEPDFEGGHGLGPPHFRGPQKILNFILN